MTDDTFVDPYELEKQSGNHGTDFPSEVVEATDAAPEEAPAEVEEAPTEEVVEEASEESEAPAEEVAPAPEPTPEPEPPLKARQLAAFLKKEKRQQEQAKKLEEQQKQLEEQKQQLSTRPKLKEIKDPVERYKALQAEGFDDPTELANAIYEAKLAQEGLLENLPPETKAEREALELKKKIAELEKQQEELKKQTLTAAQVAEQAKQIAKMEAKLEEIGSFANAIPDELEFLQREAKHHGAGAVTQALVQLADVRFQETGHYPTAKELAADLEGAIREQWNIHAPKSSGSDKAAEETRTVAKTHSKGSAEKKQSKSLGGADLKQKPTKPARPAFVHPDDLVEESKHYSKDE